MGLAPQNCRKRSSEDHQEIERGRRGLLPAGRARTPNSALRYATYGLILGVRPHRSWMAVAPRTCGENEDVKEFLSRRRRRGAAAFKNVKHYKRRKRWLALSGAVRADAGCGAAEGGDPDNGANSRLRLARCGGRRIN